MTQKIYVIDTSVYLTDFSSLRAFEDNDIIKMDYYYRFSIEENGIEYPKSNIFTVRGT